jgi:hypothetical protein
LRGILKGKRELNRKEEFPSNQYIAALFGFVESTRKSERKGSALCTQLGNKATDIL